MKLWQEKVMLSKRVSFQPCELFLSENNVLETWQLKPIKTLVELCDFNNSKIIMGDDEVMRLEIKGF